MTGKTGPTSGRLIGRAKGVKASGGRGGQIIATETVPLRETNP